MYDKDCPRCDEIMKFEQKSRKWICANCGKEVEKDGK